MNTRNRQNLSIIEAVETLSSIADLEFDQEIGITEDHELTFQDSTINYKTVHWLNKDDASATVDIVRDTFRVVLNYLKQFYRKEYGYLTDPKTIEGIKTIMVLVGEAAKKLDKYTNLFHAKHQQSVTDLKEYKQLQEFYLSKIARRIDDGVLGKWILGLSLGKKGKETTPLLVGVSEATAIAKLQAETKHVFVDLESVKKDIDYDLFFIRKEDGTRFFSPRLLRNIKLVCDFGNYFGEPKGADPLINIDRWLDRVFHEAAKTMIQSLGQNLEHYFHDMRRNKDNELSDLLSKAFLALMLSAHPENLVRNDPVKTCTEYFEDFLGFLRGILTSRTYQKWVAYPPKSTNEFAQDTLKIIHILSRSLYAGLKGVEETVAIIHMLVQEALQGVSQEHIDAALSSKTIWSYLAGDYAAMTKLMKRHPNGPMVKILNALEENPFQPFDLFLLDNIPAYLYSIYHDEIKFDNLRFGAPITQESINKAVVNEEFKGFLRAYKETEKKHLLFNLQDRTSWVDHARCVALEELENSSELNQNIAVVTMAIDTDFYHQLAPYSQINHATTFIDLFKEHIKGEGSGFFFPSSIDKNELFEFIDRTIDAVHRIFFSLKNVLLREHRLDFIEIVYLFLQLKLIDMTQPTSFSFTSKDGIDIGMPYSVELFVLYKLMNNQKWTESDRDFINYMIHGPAILFRQRLLFPDRFNRMLSAIKTMENIHHELGGDQLTKMIQESFFSLFDTPLLNCKTT